MDERERDLKGRTRRERWEGLGYAALIFSPSRIGGGQEEKISRLGVLSNVWSDFVCVVEGGAEPCERLAASTYAWPSHTREGKQSRNHARQAKDPKESKITNVARVRKELEKWCVGLP